MAGLTDATGDPRVRGVLAVDAAVNLALGVPLLLAPRAIARSLALPEATQTFYPRVLGAVLTGIASALLVERRRVGSTEPVGLGTGGAIVINGLGGAAVGLWLFSAEAGRLPARGRALLGVVAASVLAVGAVEARCEFLARRRSAPSRHVS